MPPDIANQTDVQENQECHYPILRPRDIPQDNGRLGSASLILHKRPADLPGQNALPQNMESDTAAATAIRGGAT